MRLSGGAPAMPSGNGKDAPMRLDCNGCTWRALGLPEFVFTEAVAHADATGHAVTYRGHVQDLSKFVHKKAGAA